MNNEQTVIKPDKSYRKTYVLKQQTPMIHFQHADSGVVIRASEFKPKLDKFLLKKLVKKLDNDLEGKKNWFLKQADGNQDIKAFNYKVRIFATGKPKRNQNINKMYFANMGKDSSDQLQTIFYETDIYVEIQCFVKELLEYIDANISEFLLVTNFGTRQSKGFGCFDLKKENDNVNTPIDILKDNKYDFVYCEVENPKKALNVAAGIYAVMKGGVNFSNTYVKGYIQRQYLNDIGKKNIGSDKAFIKAEILPAIQRKIEKGSDNFQKYDGYEYVRAILGVPESIGFRDPNSKQQVTVSINGKNDGIERFQSAIQIVVSGKYVILIMKDSYTDILEKKFVFSTKIGNGTINETINVPSEFNPEKFLSGFVNYFNNEKSKLENLKYVKLIDVSEVKN